MKHVVSFSGGLTSAYLVHLKPDADYILMDTGAEHEKTYEFIKRVVKEWDINLVCLRVIVNPELGKGNSYKVIGLDDLKPDLQPWKDMIKKYGTPYAAGGEFCTDRMKTTPYLKYCNDVYGEGNYVTWLGMRADEPKRLREKEGIRYLAEISDFEKDDIKEWWRNQPFTLGIDEHLGNCVFCIKKSIGKVGLATKDERVDALKFASMLNGKDVRVLDSRATPSLVMYRGNNTLKQVIDTYQDMDRNNLAMTLKLSKRDEGGCSESRELFSEYQTDLFKQI